MCGIAGLVDPSGGPIDRALLAAMIEKLSPRGPDGEGVYITDGVGLGHRRLAVVDTSPAAAQPMTNEDGTMYVVANAEIYNHLDLRAELVACGHQFRSRSDTEVLVHGFEQWGLDLPAHLDGMFSFAVWDVRARRLFAARDRLGKKPLYYASIPRDGAPPVFAFASELKALWMIPGLDRSIDRAALSRYLIFDYVPEPYTIACGARKLAAAHTLVVDPDGNLKTTRYWDFPDPAPCTTSLDQAAADLRTILRRAVEKRLMGDVPVGLLLSGGLDSSALAVTVQDLGLASQMDTFCLGFSDVAAVTYDERAAARTVAQHLGMRHHQVAVCGADLRDALSQSMRTLDEPFADPSFLPTLLLSRFARGQVTVALGGDGGDELFSGYPTFAADKPARFLLAPGVSGVLAGAASFIPPGDGYRSLGFRISQFMRGGPDAGPRRHQRWIGSFLPEELSALLNPGFVSDTDDPLSALDALAAPPHDLLAFYLRHYLGQNLNVKTDRAAGACGLELRSPFLDLDLVNFAFHLPPGLRRHGLRGKRLLRHAFRDDLPPAIVNRPKHGFGLPVASWLRTDLRSLLLDELSPSRIKEQGIFNLNAVTSLLKNHLDGSTDHRKTLWTLMMFQLWHRQAMSA